MESSPAQNFIARWQNSGGAERANYAISLTQLCDLPGVAQPNATKPDDTDTHEHGLITVLRQFHDDLDAAVAESCALPPTASAAAILTHLCALNAQRAAEERTGQIRWLRPAFQVPATTTQTTLATVESETAANANAATLAKTFKKAKTDRIEVILKTLASLGQARVLPGGKFVTG